MRRRSLLAGAGTALFALLTGCSMPPPDTTRTSTYSRTDAGPPSTPSRTSTLTETLTETPLPQVSVETPADGSCEPTPELRPTPEISRTYHYPEFPESVSPSSARSFATTYERAYRYNSRFPDYESVQVSVTSPDWAVSETRDGYLVGLDGRVQFDEPRTVTPTTSSTPTSTSTSTTTPTETAPLPSGFVEFSVWYYVTERYVLRGDPSIEPLSEERAPDLTVAAVVACAAEQA